MHVLVVHSDPRFYRELRGLLSAQEASGAYLQNLSEIQAQIEAHCPDLIVLEQRCLSDGSTFLGDAFANGRAQRLPIIYLTSADCERLRSGEEPHRLADLLAHVRSQTERARTQQVTQIGRLRIHAGRMRVAMDGRWVRLPPIQFRILQHLAANANELVSHRELLSIVWGNTATNDKTPDLLKVHITQLRRRLGPEFRDYVQAVRGQGYVLINPDDED